ncbi:MAG: tetratricopeptide repeat protein [Planctomycetota bacterium]|jgi:tetratricopeptide (TPR) repeat protein
MVRKPKILGLAALLLVLGGEGLLAGDPASGETWKEKARRLIRELGDDRWAVRNQATESLASMGNPVLPFVQEALRNPDLEIRHRAKQLLPLLRWDLTPALGESLEGFLENLNPQDYLPEGIVDHLKKKGGPAAAMPLALIYHHSPSAKQAERAFWATVHLAGDREIESLRQRVEVEGYETYHLLVAKILDIRNRSEEARPHYDRAVPLKTLPHLLPQCKVDFALNLGDLPWATATFHDRNPLACKREQLASLPLRSSWHSIFTGRFLYGKEPLASIAAKRLSEGTPDEVRQVLAVLAAFFPHRRIFTVLGDIHRLQGRGEIAFSWYALAHREDPKNPDLLEQQLRLLLQDNAPSRVGSLPRIWQTLWRIAPREKLHRFIAGITCESLDPSLEFLCRLAEAVPPSCPILFQNLRRVRSNWMAELRRLAYKEERKLAILLYVDHHLSPTICNPKKVLPLAERARVLFPEDEGIVALLIETLACGGAFTRLGALHREAVQFPEPARSRLRGKILEVFRNQDGPAARDARFNILVTLESGEEAEALRGVLHRTASPTEIRLWKMGWKKSGPHPERAAYLFGLYHRDRREWKEAQFWFTECLRLSKESLGARGGLVESLANLGDWDGALREAEKLVVSTGKDRGILSLGYLLSTSAVGFPELPPNAKASLLWFHFSACGGPLEKKAWWVLHTALPEGGVVPLIERFQKRPSPRLALAIAVAKKMDLTWVEKALALAPDDPQARLCAMKARLEAGDVAGFRALIPADETVPEFLDLSLETLLVRLPEKIRGDPVPILVEIAASTRGSTQTISMRLAALHARDEDMPFLLAGTPKEAGIRQFILGFVHLRAGRRQEAESAFRKAEETGITVDVDLPFLEGICKRREWKLAALLLAGRPETAHRAIRNHLRKGEAEYVTLLAELDSVPGILMDDVALVDQLPDWALEKAEQAIYGREEVGALRVLGWIKLRQGNEGEARSLFRRAFRKNPRDIRNAFGFARALRNAENGCKDALELYQRLLQLHKGAETHQKNARLRANIILIIAFSREFLPLLERAFNDPAESVVDVALRRWTRDAGPGDRKRLLASGRRLPPRVRKRIVEAQLVEPDGEEDE